MKVSKEAMKDMYLRMIRIREFESKAQSLFADGKIPGFVHLYLGAEPVRRWQDSRICSFVPGRRGCRHRRMCLPAG